MMLPRYTKEDAERDAKKRREQFVLAALAGGNTAKDCVDIADLVIAILDQE